MEAVTFFGLGQMGNGMAMRLLEGGYSLRVYNRSPDKAMEAVNKGAELFTEPALAVQAAGVLISMLSDDQAVSELISDEVLQPLGTGGIHLSMSTISPATVTDLKQRHKEHGVHYLACPVFGRPEAARAGKLWLCLAGDDRAKTRVRSLLEVLGQGVYDFGSKPEAANAAKLAGNFLIASSIEAMAEAFSFAEKNGVDAVKVHSLLTETLFACPIFQNYGKIILEERYEPPGFTLALGAKDIRLVRDTARNSNVPMPLAALLEDRFLRSLANGRAHMDWTAIAIDQREGSGLGK
jgi:3-hydroxyisobutyrate dehydrogenase-like beta-hydroxyacid dehydrogenase